MIKTLWRLSREAIRYRTLYIVAILSTLALTAVNLTAPKLLSAMTGLVEKGLTEEGLHTIGLMTAALVALYLLRILFRFLSNYLAHKAAWYLVGDLRTRTYDKLEHMHLGYFHDKQTGDLMSRIVNDTRDFELLYAHMIPESITNLVTFTGVLIVLLTINWKLALITCAPIPLIFLSGIIFSKKVRPFFRISQKKMGELNGKLQDNLSGIHEIQSFGREEYETERVNEKNFDHIRAMLQALKISAIFHPSVEFISSLGTILVVGFGGYLAYREGLRVEDIVAFLLYLGLFYGPVTGLANLLENMQQSMAGAERVMAVLDTPCEIQDRQDAFPLADVRGDIRFDHVSFSYDEQIPVLKDVSFHCEPGKMLALVGPTGVGKTTLTQLISRFYEPNAGRILNLGYIVYYEADACVCHSHNYSALQQFHRNFDLAVSQADHPEVFGGIRSESEGIRMVRKTGGFLKARGELRLLPRLILLSGAKYLGYRLGKNYRSLPMPLVRALSMNRTYWEKTDE